MLNESTRHRKHFPQLDATKTTIGVYQLQAIQREYAGQTVYRALEHELGNLVHVTILHNMKLSTAAPLRDSVNIIKMRLVEVAEGLALSRNHNFLPMLASGESNGSPYFVQPLFEGKTLAETLTEQGRLSLEECMTLFAQLAASIDSLHAKNLFHGSLCSEAVLINRRGIAAIADLGSEYALHPLMIHRDEPSFCELQYRAPETFRGSFLNRNADLYSFSIIAFEALTGRSPFSSVSADPLKSEMVTGHRERLSNLITGDTVAVDAVFARALAPQPARRFNSAREFVCALASAFGIEPLSLIFKAGPEPLQKKRSFVPAYESTVTNSTATESGFILQKSSGEKLSLKSPRSAEIFEFCRAGPASPEKSELRSKFAKYGIGVFAVAVFATLAIITTYHSDGLESARTSFDLNSYHLASDDIVEPPEIEPANSATPLSELSDPQLLGIIWNGAANPSITINALQEAEQRHASKLINAAVASLQSKDDAVRIATAQIVAGLGDKRIVPFLIPLLTDPNSAVRSAGARSVGALGNRKTLPFLISRFNNEEDSVVRRDLKIAINIISGYSAVKTENPN